MKVLALCLCGIVAAPADNTNLFPRPAKPAANPLRGHFVREPGAETSAAKGALIGLSLTDPQDVFRPSVAGHRPDAPELLRAGRAVSSRVPAHRDNGFDNKRRSDPELESFPNWGSEIRETIFRGQSPRGFFGGADPFNQPAGAPVDPYAGLPGGTLMFGANAPRPYEFGWIRRLEMTYMPESLTTGGDRFSAFETDFEMEYTQPWMSGMMFRWTPGFGLRLWDGPLNSHLPSQAYRISSDLELSTPQQGRWSSVLGFTPSLNSDFEQDPTDESFNWDGRAYVLYQMNPFWKAMVGVEYWNRVNDYFIPHAGFIYTDDVWEMRLTVPEARLSLFVGNELGCGKWIYISGAFNVDSYEIDSPGTGRDEVEFRDYRVMIGSRMDTGRSSFFFEGGWVFGRDVEFANTPAANFDIKTNFVGRVGFRF